MRNDVFPDSDHHPAPIMQPLATVRVETAKRSFVTRRMDLGLASGIIVGNARPRAGDLVLARVETIGQHKRLEQPDGRRATLFPGDEILVVYGNRYAPDQFEARVPEDLGSCSLVAAGGIAAEVQRKSARVRAATRIQPIGLITDAAGRRLSTQGFSIPVPPRSATHPPVLAVLGSSMNAGKTTTLAAFAHGEARAGRRVGAVKVTGTGAGGDLWSYRDAGAELAFDFTDAGHATTNKLPPPILEVVLERLVAHTAAQGAEIILVEVADGLLLDETAKLIESPSFRRLVDGVVFAGADAMGTLAGRAWLAERGWPPLALAGAVTASPLATSEVEANCSTPVVTLEALHSGAVLASDLLVESRVAA